MANIVAETMDNYLLYGHILKCKVLPKSAIGDVERLFKGANRRFKRVPWNDVARRNLEKKRTAEEWDRMAQREEKRRKSREEKLKKVGIEYEFEAKVRVADAPAAATKEAETVAEPVVVEEQQQQEKPKKKGGKKEKSAPKLIEESPASAAPAVKVKLGEAVEEKEKVPVKKSGRVRKARK